MSAILAKDVMVSPAISVQTDTSCEELMHLLITKRISGVPVVDETGTLVGIISIRDIIRIKVEMPYAPDMFYLSKGYLKENMTRNVYTAVADDPIEGIANAMFERRIHRTIVVDDETRSKPIGIITTFDLLKVVGGRL